MRRGYMQKQYMRLTTEQKVAKALELQEKIWAGIEAGLEDTKEGRKELGSYRRQMTRLHDGGYEQESNAISEALRANIERLNAKYPKAAR